MILSHRACFQIKISEYLTFYTVKQMIIGILTGKMNSRAYLDTGMCRDVDEHRSVSINHTLTYPLAMITSDKLSLSGQQYR